MPLVAGVDSSTQSVKVVVRDAETGDLVREGRSIHPEGTEVHPDHWWAALEEASAGLLDGVEAIGVVERHAQQPLRALPRRRPAPGSWTPIRR